MHTSQIRFEPVISCVRQRNLKFGFASQLRTNVLIEYFNGF